MTSLARTINNALQAVGAVTEDRLRDIVADFDGLNLSGEERLAAVATAIAATACNHHRLHKAVYLEAVRTWALEIAAELAPAPLRLRQSPDSERIEDGADILISGVDALIELMTVRDIRTQDRLVTELALVARLLGQNDAYTIYRTLSIVERTLKDEAYQPGRVILVPLREMTPVVGREIDLAIIEPRGCA